MQEDWIHNDLTKETILKTFDKTVNEFHLLIKNHRLSYSVTNEKINIKLTKREKTIFINIYMNDRIKVYVNGKYFRNVLIANIDFKYGEKIAEIIKEEEIRKEKILTELLGDFLIEIKDEQPVKAKVEKKSFIKRIFS